MSAEIEMKTTLSPKEVQAYRAAHPDVWLVDVREPGEYNRIHLNNARLMPLAALL